MNPHVVDRVQSPGPKKILACDGGGILGLISVEILAKIELHLRTKLGKGPDFVLADYFDFVCGTSTGAIVAACVAAGMSVDQIRAFYVDKGQQMFDRANVVKKLDYQYNAEPLAELLRTSFDQQLDETGATLGSDNLKTLLMMVLRNHSTDSPWPVSNNPFAKYNDRGRDDCNLNLPLWQLVRASTAAPTYFPPEVVSVGQQKFIFVDGGTTTYNNPAWLAFQMATAKPYAVNWSTGTDNLLIVSVGTGDYAKERPQLTVEEMNLLHYASAVPSALMNAATAGWDMTCRLVGDCRFGGPLDREIGDMVYRDDDPNWTGAKQFTYLRYNPDLSAEGIKALGLGDIDAERVRTLDAVDNIANIRRVGTAYAAKYVKVQEHFRGFV